MSAIQKQRDVIIKQSEKVTTLETKVQERQNYLRTLEAELHDMNKRKDDPPQVTRALGVLRRQHAASIATLDRHEERFARSGRPAPLGEFERNAREEIEMQRRRIARTEVDIGRADRLVRKAEEMARKARGKFEAAVAKVFDARIQLRAERAKLIRFPGPGEPVE
ncbi:hypothetical protein F4802DRAFT_603165 [Xylaria palmicola]|nr:hypothetical protein F4802DRAFT_603165 [Xylaria palmicola]